MQAIFYKGGGGPALIDVIGGQVELSFLTPIAVIAHIKSGRVKAIGITGETRSSALPQVPTFTEASLPDIETRVWFGVLAPAGIPKGIISKLSTEIARIIATSDYKDKLAGQGMEPFVATPDQFAERMKTDMARSVKVIKTANIKIEN